MESYKKKSLQEIMSPETCFLQFGMYGIVESD